MKTFNGTKVALFFMAALLATPTAHAQAGGKDMTMQQGQMGQMQQMQQMRGQMGKGGEMITNARMGQGGMGMMKGPMSGMRGRMMGGMMKRMRAMMMAGMMKRAHPLSAEDVRRIIDGHLSMMGLSKLSARNVKVVDEKTATADVVAPKGEVIMRLEVNRAMGRMKIVD